MLREGDSFKTEEQTALRELREETGLHAALVPGKRAVSEYEMQHIGRRKQVVLFLGEAEGRIILQESEALDYKWVKASVLKEYLHQDTYSKIQPLI